MKNRILYIDYMKAIAISLVIVAHVNFANAPVKAWICSFHMPAFFFCAGMVFKVGAFSLKEVFRNKFHRIMIPYLIWALFYAKFSVMNSLKIFYGSSWSVASSGALSSLWFLPVMFMALGLFYLFAKTGMANRLSSKIILMIIAFLAASLIPHVKFGYPLGFDVAIMAFAFMLLGNICKDFISRQHLYFKNHTKQGLLAGILLLVVFALGTQTYQFNIHEGHIVIVMMKSASYGNLGLFSLIAVCGTLMLLYLSIVIDLFHKKGYGWLSFIGQNTLVIFVVHKPIIGIFKVIFSHFPISSLAALVITSVMTLLISCYLCKLINMYAPVLAGRKEN